MNAYKVRVVANVNLEFICHEESSEDAKKVVDAMSYESLVEEGMCSIYSTEEIDLKDDVEFIGEVEDETL